MSQALIITNKIEINASPEKVWDVVVNSDHTKKYMFGCEAVSDWKVGSSLIWRMDYEGKEFIAVKGHIKNIIQNQTLSYTVIDPNNTSIEDIPENYLTVTYHLELVNNTTIFTVTQGDYNLVADGEKRYKESYNNGEGWTPILVQIKEIAETL